jgi:tRNA pseudouridine38-40 synthase
MKRNLFLCLEYDGTRYQGWQRQAAGPTVQGEIERALSEATGGVVSLRAAGRTDAGVHALGQAANCFVETALPIRAIFHRANQALPEDIVIRRMAEAPAEFDARRHASLRHYRYHLLHRAPRPALGRHTCAHFAGRLDHSLLQQTVALFEGHHDFAAFRSSACRAKRTFLTMIHSRLTLDGDHLIFDFACRSFLQHMVRVLVGTALDVARGRMGPTDVERLLAGKGNRSQAGRTAPPQGLVLLGIEYARPYEQFSTL